MTKSGRVCQKWSTQFPHTHVATPESRPEQGLESNFCRNPDGANLSIWCFTSDPKKRWEECEELEESDPEGLWGEYG